jgi:histone H2A
MQVHPDNSISSSAKYTINEMIKSFIVDMTNCAAKLALDANKKTLSYREIQAAVAIVIPHIDSLREDLSRHAVSEGTKAVTKYNSAIYDRKQYTGQKKNTSIAALAGLTFSPSRVRALMRMHSSIGRIGVGAAVYLTAVVEYLIAELLEYSGNYARDAKRVRIINRDLRFTVSNKEELGKLFSSKKYLLGGGVMPTLTKPTKNE